MSQQGDNKETNNDLKVIEANMSDEPADESAMPYLVDLRAIKAYADSKGVAITSLTDQIINVQYLLKGEERIATSARLLCHLLPAGWPHAAALCR